MTLSESMQLAYAGPAEVAVVALVAGLFGVWLEHRLEHREHPNRPLAALVAAYLMAGAIGVGVIHALGSGDF